MKVNKTISLDIECAAWLDGKNASSLINTVIQEALEKERKEVLDKDLRTKCAMCGALNMLHIRTCGGCGRPVNTKKGPSWGDGVGPEETQVLREEPKCLVEKEVKE